MRKRLTPRRRPPAPPRRLRDRWNIQRATTVGIATGLAALLLSSWSEELRLPYAALVALTLVCGLSILWITFADIRARRRGQQVRPIRTFDVIIGVVLAGPALYAAWRLWPLL